MAIVEEFDLDEDAPDGGRSGDLPPRARRRHRAAPWVAAALVLVLAGAAVAAPLPIILGRGEGLEIGLLDLPLEQPPTMTWQTELTYPSVVASDVPGRVIVTTGDDGTSRTVVALDRGTGAEVWRYEDESNSCQWGAQTICVTAPGTRNAVVVTIDTESGAMTTAEHPAAVAAIATERGTVVVEERRGTAIEEVVLVAPDGTERWRVEADMAETESDPAWVMMRVTDGVLVSDYSGSALTLSTGEPATAPQLVGYEGYTVEQTDNGYLLHTASGDIQIGPSELMLWLDDDLGGPVVLRQDSSGAITASVRSDGTELWQLVDPQCYPWMRLQGSIVIGCWGEDGEGVAAALDELTGEERWTADDADWPMAASTDAVLLSSGDRSAIIAVDPRDGQELWSQPLPDLGYGNYVTIDGGMLVASDSAVSLLTW